MELLANLAWGGFVTFLAFVVVIGSCVLVHELGHYWIARRVGIAVEVFSIGFGPPLVSWKRGGTEWRISSVPLGGYVKMKGEAAGEGAAEPDAFQAKPPLARMAVVAAGPLANIVFAVVLWAGVFAVVGIEETYIEPRLGDVVEGSAAWKAGLRRHDVLVAVEGEPVETYYGFLERLRNKAGETVAVRVRRTGGEETTVRVPVVPRPLPDDPLFAYRLRAEEILFGTGYVEGILPYVPPVVGEPIPGRPAEQAGISPGDRVLRVNGEAVADWAEMAERIRGAPGETVALFVARNGEELRFEIPTETEAVELADGTIRTFQAIGIRPKGRIHRLDPFRATWEGAWQVLGIGRQVVVTVARLMTGEISFRYLMGPVGIAQASGRTALRGELVFFIILLSVNLGFINCVPLPLLDGGYLFFFLPYEMLLRRPPSPKFVEWASNAAFAAILIFFAMVTYNDVLRWLTQ